MDLYTYNNDKNNTHTSIVTVITKRVILTKAKEAYQGVI